jgi:hypothetical protein
VILQITLTGERSAEPRVLQGVRDGLHAFPPIGQLNASRCVGTRSRDRGCQHDGRPMVVEREVSTPLSSLAITGAVHGGVYGVEESPRRFLSDSLRARTPVPVFT